MRLTNFISLVAPGKIPRWLPPFGVVDTRSKSWPPWPPWSPWPPWPWWPWWWWPWWWRAAFLGLEPHWKVMGMPVSICIPQCHILFYVLCLALQCHILFYLFFCQIIVNLWIAFLRCIELVWLLFLIIVFISLFLFFYYFSRFFSYIFTFKAAFWFVYVP